MKHASFSAAVAVALIAAPVAVWADANPDFDDDAKPILKAQPGLIQYIQSHFQVKDTGTAKYPGDDDRRPGPPYIFRARPIGSEGPYNLRLLIQPGPPGHILGVVDVTKVHLTAPGSAPTPPSMPGPPPQQPVAEAPTAPEPPPAPQPPAPAEEPAPSAPATPAPAQQPSEPSADTPSGPIMGPDNSSSSSSGGQPNLAPPPDPAPPAQ